MEEYSWVRISSVCHLKDHNREEEWHTMVECPSSSRLINSFGCMYINSRRRVFFGTSKCRYAHMIDSMY